MSESNPKTVDYVFLMRTNVVERPSSMDYPVFLQCLCRATAGLQGRGRTWWQGTHQSAADIFEVLPAAERRSSAAGSSGEVIYY